MLVYILKELTDTEYGTYEIDSVYFTREKAEKALQEYGQEKISVWYRDDEGEDRYIIEEYEVH